MFILSAGMPKSGSTLLSLYQKNIVLNLMKNNGQTDFENLIKTGELNGIGIFVDNLDSSDVVEKLVSISKEIGPFVVKSHVPLTPGIKTLILDKQIFASYILRDPRDVLLSAIDHGKRTIQQPEFNNPFISFNNLPNSIPFVREFCKIALDWISCAECQLFSYTDLILQPKKIMENFCRQIGVLTDQPLFDKLITIYSTNSVKGKRQFNTGKLTRFEDELTIDEIAMCNTEMMAEILKLGYKL